MFSPPFAAPSLKKPNLRLWLKLDDALSDQGDKTVSEGGANTWLGGGPSPFVTSHPDLCALLIGGAVQAKGRDEIFSFVH